METYTGEVTHSFQSFVCARRITPGSSFRIVKVEKQKHRALFECEESSSLHQNCCVSVSLKIQWLPFGNWEEERKRVEEEEEKRGGEKVAEFFIQLC